MAAQNGKPNWLHNLQIALGTMTVQEMQHVHDMHAHKIEELKAEVACHQAALGMIESEFSTKVMKGGTK
jgi:hypothetical protein